MQRVAVFVVKGQTYVDFVKKHVHRRICADQHAVMI